MTAAPSVLRSRPFLVTGGAGFIGSNLADRLAREGQDVLVFDALARPGVERNLRWLQQRHPRRISLAQADIRDAAAVRDAATRCSGVFHMAAQVAVTTSLQSPMDDFDVNVRGAMHLLEALRRRTDRVPMVFASTNKVYGDLRDVPLAEQDRAYQPTDPALRATGIGEQQPLDFHTPYGCSKGAADQYVLDYARSYRPARLRAAYELHLRPAPNGHGGSGLARAFPHFRTGRPADQHLRRRFAGAGCAVRG